MKKSIVIGLVAVLYRIGVLHLFFWWDKTFGRRHHVAVLTYHHLSDGKDDEEAISELQKGMNHSEFEQQISQIRRWHKPIDVEELEKVVDGQSKLETDRFLVTFDDGYSDNLTLGVPCLQRHGALGVIFIATDFIDSDKRFWWVRLTDSIRTMDAKDWETMKNLDSIPDRIRTAISQHSLSNWQSRKETRAVLGQMLGTLQPVVRESFLDQLEVFANPPETSCLPLLSWSQIRQMHSSMGVAFGAHTHTHPLMTQTDPTEVSEDLDCCANRFEKEIGMIPRSFAYPSGDFDEDVVAIVAKSDFDFAFTTRLGTITSETSRYKLPRIYLSGAGLSELITQIFFLKLAKYFPRTVWPILARVTGQRC